jgi:hypothetical protein
MLLGAAREGFIQTDTLGEPSGATQTHVSMGRGANPQ